MLQYLLLHMNRLNKTESAIFVSLMRFLLPEDLHLEFILSSLLLVLCRVAAVKRLPVHHHSADYIFLVLGIIGLILSLKKAILAYVNYNVP